MIATAAQPSSCCDQMRWAISMELIGIIDEKVYITPADGSEWRILFCPFCGTAVDTNA